MAASTIIKDCEVCGVSMYTVGEQIDRSEEFIRELKSSIKDLVMSTPREITIADEHYTWLDYANIALNDLFKELETELLHLSNLYLIKSELDYNPKNVEDNS